MNKRVFRGNYYRITSPADADVKDVKSGRTLAQIVAGKATVIQAIGDYITAPDGVTVEPYRKSDFTLAKHGSLQADVPPLRGTSAYLYGLSSGEYVVNLGQYKQAPYLLYNRETVAKVTLLADAEPTGLTATFYDCTSLTELDTALTLGALTSATSTFRNTALTYLPEQITLAALADGSNFFGGTPLQRVPAALNLAALSTGAGMFSGCRLDLPSVQRIAATVKTWTSGDHPLTVGISAELEGDADLEAALDELAAKGWTVAEEYNG